MRFLGIDYGTKRIGVAVSDENIILAFPKGILPNDLNIFKNLGEILKTENVSEIVVGESVDFKGQENVVSKEIEIFISELKNKFNLPVHKQKEFLTSVEARGEGGKEKNNDRKIKRESSKKIDDSAAALILQRYLDRRNLQK